ncbi:TetR/AcrR family transcriptional regulator [Pontibacter sp. G13]|uniref:TetR/AcrR family transcriptional regulator n=1 Tax=Pontibacter sp. G13 TaxID=3074898 RepID=UPI00288A0BA2|nr:TetR/AcrR family transcriptional regulator [Pontibacter sp. G13]WNJ17610.1 TetR/AcrR family transcriptional regulator [Pontibacter sp. G13]
MDKRAKTRQHIIESTAELFNKKGFAGTSMADITQATGLTKGSVYGNFKNKDEVATAVFLHNYQLIVEGIAAELKPRNSPLDKIYGYVAFYRREYQMMFLKGGCPLLNTAMDADDTHPLLAEQAKMVLGKWKKHLIRLVEKGQEAGEIDPETVPNRFAMMMISLLEGGIAMAKASGDHSYLFHAFEEIELRIREMSLIPVSGTS